MTPSASKSRPANKPNPADDTLYIEKQWLTGAQIGAFVTISVVAVVLLVQEYRAADPDPLSVVIVTSGAAALLLLLSLTPLTLGFSHIRIDGAGLSLWWGGLLWLPASQIGIVTAVPELHAARAARRGRFQNLKIPTGKSSYPVWGGAGTGVFVEQLRPGKPPIGWLIGTRNPDAVIAALKHLRDDDD